MTDPVALTQALIRCPSVTPKDAGAIPLLAEMLEAAGFEIHRADRGGIANMIAVWGAGSNGPILGFNGHTDVVPVGDPADWRYDPFSAEIVDGVMFGRGAADMKSGVAAWVAAAIDRVETAPPAGGLIIAITGDEEGNAVDGTRAILDAMDAQGLRMDACVVGEPTCPNKMGEMMKIGRRGSMTAYVTATGVQGHSAYPHRARNPLPVLIAFLDRLARHELDQGSDHFDPSTLAVTTVDTGNPANNVIPAAATATVNIRFNDLHSSQALSDWLRSEALEISAGSDVSLDLRFQVSGESFLTPPGALSALIAEAVEAETGIKPEASTSGGTSDARFIKSHCPVVEFGLVGQSMHQVDESVPVAQIHQLKSIYSRIIAGFFD